MNRPFPDTRVSPVPAERRAETLVLDAAAAIFENESPEAATVSRLADATGIPVDEIQAMFPGPGGVLGALARRQRTAFLEHLAKKPLATTELETAVGQFLEDAVPRYARIIGLGEAIERIVGSDADPAPDWRDRLAEAIAERLRHRGIVDAEQASADILALADRLIGPAVAAGDTRFDALTERLAPAIVDLLKPRES